jgi:hypothetical protein
MGTVRTSVTPSAARLTTSLRDIGYDFPSAVADLVDNSIAAGAGRIDVVIEFDGARSRVFLVDDGRGMSANGLLEAFRFGSRREYARNELGRYGLGLKTASLSQCRSVTVCSRMSPVQRRIATRSLDLDVIVEFDDWLVVDPGSTSAVRRAHGWLAESPGTVVIWEKLDRVLPADRPDGGWARRRVESLTRQTADHLAMVFHRFLEGTGNRQVVLTVNGDKVRPWDPFACGEPATRELPRQRFELAAAAASGHVELRRFILPARERFSSVEEFDRLSGPQKWNRQQGLYIYRADRLVQWGGWAGLRAIDEHTKLARASIDFATDLDEAFTINVSKRRVSLPAELRTMLERPVTEVCQRADEAYRVAPRRARPERETDVPTAPAPAAPCSTGLGLALRSAAALAGEYPALRRILTSLREHAPDAAAALDR